MRYQHIWKKLLSFYQNIGIQLNFRPINRQRTIKKEE